MTSGVEGRGAWLSLQLRKLGGRPGGRRVPEAMEAVPRMPMIWLDLKEAGDFHFQPAVKKVRAAPPPRPLPFSPASLRPPARDAPCASIISPGPVAGSGEARRGLHWLSFAWRTPIAPCLIPARSKSVSLPSPRPHQPRVAPAV